MVDLETNNHSWLDFFQLAKRYHLIYMLQQQKRIGGSGGEGGGGRNALPPLGPIYFIFIQFFWGKKWPINSFSHTSLELVPPGNPGSATEAASKITSNTFLSSSIGKRIIQFYGIKHINKISIALVKTKILQKGKCP